MKVIKKYKVIEYIVISKELIRSGERYSGRNCPIAKGLREKFPESDIRVTCEYINIENKSIKMPKKLGAWIIRFDRGIFVKPIRLKIRISRNVSENVIETGYKFPLIYTGV